MERGRVVLAGVAMLILLACSSTDDTDFLTVRGAMRTPVGLQLNARVEQGGRITNLSHADIMRVQSDGQSYARVDVSRSGAMHVVVIAMTSLADTIAIGELEMPLTKGFVYGVTVSREAAGKATFCFGCSGVQKFPLRGSQRNSTDSLWLTMSNAAPCKGCVY